MLKVLVIGSGMYVAGRKTDGFGTVLPSLYEASADGLVEGVHISSTCARSTRDVKRRAQKLAKFMGHRAPLHFSPLRGKDNNAFKKALKVTKFDCAIIVVPDHLHCKIASEVLKAGVHTLIVKPLTTTVKEARQLISLAKANKVYGVVEFHKRYDEANLKLRDLIFEGALGDVLNISVAYSQRKIIPTKFFEDWSTKTNIFQYLGVHYVDLIHFITRAKPIRVTATGQKYWLAKKGINTYDAIQTFIEWKCLNGKKFTSSIATNWIDPNNTTAMSDQKISVIGTKGRVDSDQKNRGVQIVTDAKGVEDFNPYFSQFYGDGNGFKKFQGYGEKSIRQFLEDVCFIQQGANTIKDFEGSRPTFKEGLVSTSVLEAVDKSLRTNNKWVSCSLR